MYIERVILSFSANFNIDSPDFIYFNATAKSEISIYRFYFVFGMQGLPLMYIFSLKLYLEIVI